ncbi:MAG TPA: hypothetical protein VF516_13015, partial [Kofleriaceae bacterium]
GKATDVKLTSASTNIATVPDHVTVSAGASSAEIQYTSVAPGTAIFHATAGSDSVTTTAAVVDAMRVTPPSATTLEVGAHGILLEQLNITVPDAITVPLSSSQTSIATVDDSVAISKFSSSGLAQITAVSPGASIISASFSGQQASQTITVVDKAQISQVSGTSLFEVGGHGTAQISLNAQLASAAQLTVSPSDASVVSVARTFTIAPGSTFASLDVQGMATGSTNMVFSLNNSTATLPIMVVSKAQLENVFVNTAPSVGYTMQLTVSMNVIAATAHDVTLTSSDPTVVAVPPTVTVFAGKSSASVAITPLKAGDAVITASYNGISRQIDIPIGNSGYAINMYGQTRYVVGALGSISVQTGVSAPTTVSLQSSDPTVVTVPSSLIVNNSEVAPLTALKAGTATITATTNGASATYQVAVVASPGISQFGPSFSVPVNGSMNGYMYLDTPSPSGTAITFTTSDATIAPAPASVTLTNGQTSIPLLIKGGATGTATITANIAGARASAVVYVGSSSAGTGFQNLYVNGYSNLEIGAATLLYAYFYPSPPTGATGTITFGTAGILSTPSTTLPISSSSCCNYFPVVGAVAGSSDVTVTVNGVSQTTTINVVSSPTYSLGLTSTVKTGSVVTATISSNAVVAADRTFTLSSSNPAVATVTSPTATIGPSSSSLQATFGVRGVAAGTATITGTISGKTVTANITVQ